MCRVKINLCNSLFIHSKTHNWNVPECTGFYRPYTKRQNELFSEVRKLLSQTCTDVPAQLPSAMLPRQDMELVKKTVIQTSETLHFVS